MEVWRGETDIASIENDAGMQNGNLIDQIFDHDENSYWQSRDFSYMSPMRQVHFLFKVKLNINPVFEPF